ncbi:MAG: hypothetical protein JOY61_13240 [Chloroflexi bacterium]|nr:hypothetical protein [Chloroflexota bacterium]
MLTQNHAEVSERGGATKQTHGETRAAVADRNLRDSVEAIFDAQVITQPAIDGDRLRERGACTRGLGQHSLGARDGKQSTRKTPGVRGVTMRGDACVQSDVARDDTGRTGDDDPVLDGRDGSQPVTSHYSP